MSSLSMRAPPDHFASTSSAAARPQFSQYQQAAPPVSAPVGWQNPGPMLPPSYAASISAAGGTHSVRREGYAPEDLDPDIAELATEDIRQWLWEHNQVPAIWHVVHRCYRCTPRHGQANWATQLKGCGFSPTQIRELIDLLKLGRATMRG